MLTLVVCVAAPVASVSALWILADEPGSPLLSLRKALTSHLPGYLPLMALLFLAAVGGALIGGLFWRNRLARREDDIIALCHQMSLGASTAFTGQNSDRLELAVCIMRDAVLDQHSHYRQFFQAAKDMFVSVSPANLRVLDVNPALTQAMGLNRSSVIGMKVASLIRLDPGWETAMNQPERLYKGRFLGEGRQMRLEVSVSVQRGAKGTPWFFGAILRDVTERETLAEKLMDKTQALERALEEIRSVEKIKDEFLTTLSHELKTPLVSLKGFLQLLLRDQGHSEQTHGHLEVCWRNLQKLEKQINNLLDLARLSQAKGQYPLAPLDLRPLLNATCENLRPIARERNVEISIEPDSLQSAVISGNAEKMAQLMDNLIVNAVKYNKEAGQVRVGLLRRDGKVVLMVQDSGVGIAREHMANIFNRFYQADISGTGRLEGLGIGLSLVQEIVQLHNGDITVDSEVDNGTTFTVTLEAASEH